MTAALAVRDLGVTAGDTALVRGVGFELGAGQALTVVGESGSGKSLLARALMGTLPAGLQASGEVRLSGRVMDASARRAAWGRQIALLPQEPWSALDPTMRAVAQVAEVHRWVRGSPAAAAAQAAGGALAQLGLSADARRRYPHQLSGGMAQRVALAATLAGGAPLILVDEPTKGLDADRRDDVVALLQGVQAAGGAVVAITHDLAVARALGGQLLVMREAEVAEQGAAAEVLAAPRHAYTRALLQADPAGWPARAVAGAEAGAGEAGAGSAAAPVIEARGLGLQRGGRWLFRALDLALGRGERCAVLGASGAGKTSLGSVLLGLLPPSEGEVRTAQGLRPHGLQKLYQDPLAAFAPRIALQAALGDFLRLHGLAPGRLHALREAMGLPAGLLERLPHEVSGGELQRLALLRVMLLQPALLFADEPTSRLDPLTQRDVLALLLRQLEAEGTALLLVTHDPALARAVADRQLRLGGPG